MKKNFTIITSILLWFTLSLNAQTAEQILPNVTKALADQHWEEASNLFRLAVDKDLYKSEKFFQESITPDCPARAEMIHQLGFYCKGRRNYEKAYDYYKELVQLRPREIIYLISCAELEVILGKEEDAVKTYEKVLTLDNNNLAANIFFGNYYFLTADKERKMIERNYKKNSDPTRMQYANYRNELSRLVNEHYDKAKNYLEKVLSIFPSAEAKKTLEKIRKVEEESRQ
ncbi:tetratricopeptide repeat protein [Bacteroides sedimenti]|uniref:Tetratricopeptide repeat protein n=1 Tax=Bacteroides sedimenti TaxID=2136147 RepID=A0ABM8IK08_9BACE